MSGIEITPLTSTVLAGAALILVLRVVGVALSTVRILVMMRGKMLASAVLGFFEVLVYVIAIGAVVTNLSNVWNILGYCLGFSVGTLIGMWLDERMIQSYANVRIISRKNAPAIAGAIREAGYGATVDWGTGRDGSVGMVIVTVRRRETPTVCALADDVDASAFITVEEAQSVRRGYMHMVQRER